MSIERILKAFQSSIVSFLDELIEQFPQETSLIVARVFLKDQIPVTATMKNFIFKLESNDGILKKMVVDRNDKFFLENDIFSSEDVAGSGYSTTETSAITNHFRKIWLTDLDDDDKETIWTWIESFVAMAEKYQSVSKEI
jgi:hypothetical protein